MKKIGFIGAGNMASSLARAILSEEPNAQIIMNDKDKVKLRNLEQEMQITAAKSNSEVINSAEIIFIAVKPQDIPILMDEIKFNLSKQKLFVSIAAGIKIAYFESKMPKQRIIRVMPNIACLVGEMAAGFSLGTYATKQDAENIRQILDTAGRSLVIEEKYLDTVTAISGSGPAFFAFLVDAFVKAGIANGLTKEQSETLVIETMYGTARLLIEKRLKPEELIQMVASKGGTTEAGLNSLKNDRADKTILNAVNSAVRKSRELGK